MRTVRQRAFLQTIPATALLLGLMLAVAPSARAARYPSGYRWMTLRQGDVEVYVPQGYEPFARYLASRSLVHLDTLESWYGIRPKRTRIVLNPAEDQGMAMATVMPLRSEMTLTPVLDKGLRPQHGLYLDRVSAHELTHVVQFSTAAGITKPLRWLFGDAIAPLGLSPDWVAEGQAIWTESDQGGGRLHSPYHKMLFRAPLLEGKLWTLDQLSQPGTVNPIANRAYVGGAFLFASLAGELKGTSRVGAWMRNQAKLPGLQGFAFKESFSGRSAGGDYKDLQTSWREQLRQTMYQRGRAGYHVGDRLLSRARTSFRNPAWTSNTSLVVREWSYDHPERLTRMSGSPLRYEEHGPNLGTSADDGLAPFGEGVIVSRIRRGAWATMQTRSVLVRIDTDGKVHDLADPDLPGWAPAWSDAAGKLAYIARGDDGGLELRTVPLDAHGVTASAPTTHLRTMLGTLADPAWSADGNLIAFTTDLGEGEETCVLDLRDGSLREVKLVGATNVWDPAFSPKGTLWVSADVDGIFDLFEVDLRRGSAIRRTRCLTGAMEPRVSPDGRCVVYSHYTAEGFSTALLDSTRWGNRVVDATLAPFSADRFAVVDEPLDSLASFGSLRPYHAWRHAAPIFWMPMAGGTDENGYGAFLLGRDPLGLLSWRATALVGQVTQDVDLDASLTWRGLPVDLTASVNSRPANLHWQEPVLNGQGQVIGWNPREDWRRRWEGSFTAFQGLRRDRGPWSTTITPFAGYTLRERFGIEWPGSHIFGLWYHGARAGIDWYQVDGAPRDPIARHLRWINLSGEHNLPQVGDLEGDLVDLQARWHVPLNQTQLVLALTADAQAQSGALDYSRSHVRPRGYSDADLPVAQVKGGKMAKGGVEVHFPLVFVDHGLGMGWSFLTRLDASVFAEASTGWGSGKDLSAWVQDESAGSVGAEVGLGGWLFYDVPVHVSAGYAWRTLDNSGAVYVRTNLTSIPGLDLAPRAGQ